MPALALHTGVDRRTSRAGTLPDVPFALLDQSQAGDPSGWRALLHGLAETIVCHGPQDVSAAFHRIEDCRARGLHVLGLFDYELGYGIHPRLQRLLEPGPPLFRAFAFEHRDRLGRGEVDAWLAAAAPAKAGPAGVGGVVPSVSPDAYAQTFARLQDYIRDGDCYQVNYTFQIAFDYFGDPLLLYRELRNRQPVQYGAFIALEDEWILSFSPELFLRREGSRLVAKPMKGTMPRGADEAVDAALKHALASDEKNRAEHIMIVDLLRNDLGRVARTGGVSVPRLFDVETYRTLFQMTSTIEAAVEPGLALETIFGALFPCGSVTGAPKLRSMEIIAEAERSARGVYCGAIGIVQPDGDFCFNVPIRTIVLDARGRGRLGVGSGIVHDSTARDEYEECLLKATFVTGLDPGFSLVETLGSAGPGYSNLGLHLARLQASAKYFGFAFDEASIRAGLQAHRASSAHEAPLKTRLLLDKRGGLSLETSSLPQRVPRLAMIAAQRTDSSDILLRHKTTARMGYDSALRLAGELGCFDALFLNERGELTEGARSNVFLQIDGEWYTPPVTCGLLPGIMRGRLLADGNFGARERVLHGEDLQRAQRIVLTNAVRGVMEVEVRATVPDRDTALEPR